MLKVYKYTLIDLARNKFVGGWLLLLLAITLGLFFMAWYFGVALLQSAKTLLKGEKA